MDSQQPKTGFFRSVAIFLRLTSIHGRLIFTLALFSILPVAVTGFFVNTISSNFARTKVQDNLAAVSALKSNQVRSWARELKANLSTGIAQDTVDISTNLLNLDPASIIYATLSQRELTIFNRMVGSQSLYAEIMLLDTHGTVILSTSSDQIGKNLADKEFFKQMMAGRAAMNTTYDHAEVFATQPLGIAQGVPLGVLVGRANIKPLYALLNDKTGLGTTGEAYLVGKDKRLLSPVNTQTQLTPGETILESAGIENALSQQPGLGVYDNYIGTPVIGAYQWIPELQAAIISEQTQAEAYQFLRTSASLTILALVISSFLAVLAALSISNSFSRPLIELAETARQIAAGNLELRVRTEASNITGQTEETNTLAISFNSMTAQLRNLIGSLENRINERTRQLQTRSDQLMAASEVGRYATTLLETEQLIQRTVELIKERFNLYYVGLFTVDDSGDWAVLKAGTGTAGQIMLQRGHRLAIQRGVSDENAAASRQGRPSMIGWCIAHNQARIALEALEDPVRLATPDLPDTRSEAAIPLRSRGQVLGAMTIQSAKPGAFDKEMITVLQNMADQVAVALDNAGLFAQIQRSLDSSRQAFAEITHQAWQEKLLSKPVLLRRDSMGLRKHILQTGEVPAKPIAPITPGEEAIMVPIQTRGQTIGYINAQKRQPTATLTASSEPSNGENVSTWNVDEVKLLQSLIEQMGIALDSARLFEETQLQARHERIVGDITSHIRASLDVHNILQTAARELRDELGLEEAEIRLIEIIRPKVVTGRLADKGQPHLQPEIGYRCTISGKISEATGSWSPYLLQARYTGKTILPDPMTLALPIKIREQVHGVIKLCKPGGVETWSKDEIEMAETLSERLGAAIESARLYEETRRRAERERLTSEIIAKMRASNDPRTILQTAAYELRRALNIDRPQPTTDAEQNTELANGEPSSGIDPGVANS